MADDLNGMFEITPFTAGNPPVGINLTRPAFQSVRVGAPVNGWIFQKVEQDTYKLRAGGYPYVGVEGDTVIASIYPAQEAEWKIVRHDHQGGAFTIALANKPDFGWTIPVGDEEGRMVVIAPIIETRSFPPQFMSHQLFLVKPSEAN